MTIAEKKENPRWSGLVVWFALMAAVFSGTIYGATVLIGDWSLRIKLNSDGVEARATVVDFHRTTRGLKIRLPTCDVSYEYQVDENIYQGREDLEESRCRGYSKNLTTLPIRYLPDQPSRAWVRDNTQNLMTDFINAVLLLMGLGACVAFMYATVKDWKSEWRQKDTSNPKE